MGDNVRGNSAPSASSTGANDESNNRALSTELKRIYNSPEDPGSYGGVERLYSRAKALRVPRVTRKKVKEFLKGEQSYTLHRQARRHFTRNHVYAAGIDDQWQADLADMQSLSRQNKGIKYLLTCIDVFSKYAWVIPIRAKSAEVLAEAFKQLFRESAPRKPRRFQTDKGKEFLNSTVQNLLRNTYNIKHFTSCSDQKACIVERFNRTLKTRMWQYFTAHQTRHYLDILPKLVQAYNHSWHRAIGAVPANVQKRDEPSIRKRLYSTTSSKRRGSGEGAAAAAAAARRPAPAPAPRSHRSAPPKAATEEGESGDELLHSGAIVRISRIKGEFEKGYEQNWSMEDFRIRDFTDRPGGQRVYKLEDKAGEPIQGIWYRQELQPITVNKFLVERIIRRRPLAASGNPAQNECLVQWQGWPKKFNTWVSEADLEPTSDGNAG